MWTPRWDKWRAREADTWRRNRRRCRRINETAMATRRNVIEYIYHADALNNRIARSSRAYITMHSVKIYGWLIARRTSCRYKRKMNNVLRRDWIVSFFVISYKREGNWTEVIADAAMLLIYETAVVFLRSSSNAFVLMLFFAGIILILIIRDVALFEVFRKISDNIRCFCSEELRWLLFFTGANRFVYRTIISQIKQIALTQRSSVNCLFCIYHSNIYLIILKNRLYKRKLDSDRCKILNASFNK